MKKSLSLLLLMALAACGDSTGSRPSLTGQWLFRIRAGTLQTIPVGCQLFGAVRLGGSGNTFSGRMPVPEKSCSGSSDIAASFDSTTIVTTRVQGDSVLVTVQGGANTITQSARILGDSLYGSSSDGSTRITARRYPESVLLDRATVRLTGAITRTVELYPRGIWNGMQIVSVAQDEAVLLQPFTATQPQLGVGTYAVGSAGAPLGGYYARLVNGKADQVTFYSGTVTITQADAQIVTGTMDVTGALNGGSGTVRVQADFTGHRSGFPTGG